MQGTSPHSCIAIWLLLATRQSSFSGPRYNRHNQYRVFIPFFGFKALKAFHGCYSFFTNMGGDVGRKCVCWGCNGATPKCSLHVTDGETKGRGKKGRPWRAAHEEETLVTVITTSMQMVLPPYILSVCYHNTTGNYPLID